jgi:hypothetical protein
MDMGLGAAKLIARIDDKDVPLGNCLVDVNFSGGDFTVNVVHPREITFSRSGYLTYLRVDFGDGSYVDMPMSHTLPMNMTGTENVTVVFNG